MLVDCFAGLVLRALDERGSRPERRAGPRRRRARRARHPRRLLPPDAVDLGASRHGPRRGGFRPTPAAVPGGDPERCLSEPLGWLLLSQCQWDGELCDFARVVFDDHRRSHPEAASWELLSPPREHPAIQAWLEQRLLRLWQEKRARQASRIASARNETPPPRAVVWSGSDWVPLGEATIRPRAGCVRGPDSSALAEVLERVLPPSDQYLVKVTWHGYAPGTYTGPLALDLLLGACPAGRSCSRDIRAAGTLAASKSTGRPTPSGTAPGSGSRILNSCGVRDWRR